MRPVLPSGRRAENREVGRRLRALRKSRNLTQSDLASRIGIQQSDLCRMENGRYRVNLDTLVKVLSEFQVSFAEFFQEDGVGRDLSGPETELLHTYRRLPPENKEEVERFARFLLEESRRISSEDPLAEFVSSREIIAD